MHARPRAPSRPFQHRHLPPYDPPVYAITDDIQRVTDALVRDFHPRKVILFGSRVYGVPRPDSDVDLLVVMPFDGSPVALMSAMLSSAYKAMRSPFSVEFHPRRPLPAGTMPDPVMRDAIEKGIVVYETPA